MESTTELRLSLNPTQAFLNTATIMTLHTDMLDHLCSLEPTICATSLDQYTEYEKVVRDHLRDTLTPPTHLVLLHLRQTGHAFQSQPDPRDPPSRPSQ